jgi:hypothetical protein
MGITFLAFLRLLAYPLREYSPFGDRTAVACVRRCRSFSGGFPNTQVREIGT